MEAIKGMTIALRRDTLANWTSVDPVLADGELAVVRENGDVQFKVGNGVSSFTQLPFAYQHGISSDSVTAKDITAKSIAQGLRSSAVPTSMAGGAFLSAAANFSQVFGYNAMSIKDDDYSFVWNGNDLSAIGQYYGSHGKGTFSVNPLSGLSGFYIGQKNLQEILCSEVNIAIDYAKDVSSAISNDYYRKFETSSSSELSTEFAKKIEIGSYENEVLTFI